MIFDANTQSIIKNGPIDGLEGWNPANGIYAYDWAFITQNKLVVLGSKALQR